MLDDSPHQKIETVLGKLEKAFANGDIEAAVNLFQEDCYWRDLVTFTWNLKTLEGHDQIRAMLTEQLARIKPHDLRQDLSEVATEDDGVTQGWIEFDTGAARGL
ncbi:MAG: nuclear transport factor 2 family protein, partial [Phyllobacterium sp.]|nr:nuclear transport factor 2 family protein [Phyllobacterium sp.]